MRPPEKTEQVFAALRTPETEALVNSRRSGDGTIQRIILETGISNVTVRRQLAKLHDQGRAHIVGWTTCSTKAPIWAKGPGQHVAKPAPMGRAEQLQYQRRYRAALKERAEMDEDELRTPTNALRRIDDYINQVRAAGPRSWFAALEAA